MLRQQLEAIRQELGESEDSETEIENLRGRIEAAGMSEEAHEQATRELERLAQMPQAAAERGVIRTYLEWMVELPGASSRRTDSIPRSAPDPRRGPLRPRQGQGPDRRVHRGALAQARPEGPILCFVGRPAPARPRSAARSARVGPRVLARLAGGVRDEAEIRGHGHLRRRAAGRIIQNLRRAGTRNPVSCSTRSTRSAPTSAATRRRRCSSARSGAERDFSDHYLEVPFDLSQVLFIATGNLMEPVPPALRDRMEVIELPATPRG